MPRATSHGNDAPQAIAAPTPPAQQGAEKPLPAPSGQEGGSTCTTAAAEPIPWRPHKRLDRGLPPHKDLVELARGYLKLQHTLWPKLAQCGVLWLENPERLETMAEEFRHGFLTGEVPVFDPQTSSHWDHLAVSYVRFSSDHSNARSLDDQLHQQLHRAHQERRFVPWAYVCGDAAVTGRTAKRHGYQLAKKILLEHRKTGAETLYLFDLGRVSRDIVETIQLARILRRERRRMISVSTNLDLASPEAEMQLAMLAMFNQQHSSQLALNVKRGTEGAAERGLSLGKPALGYRLAPDVDDQGQRSRGKDAAPLNRHVIDEATAPLVRNAFVWFGRQGWSYTRIAKHFNDHQVRGKRSWTPASIRQLLARQTYIGTVIHNRTHQHIDPETGIITTTENPRNEWIVEERPEMRIVDDTLWDLVRKRAEQVRDAAPCTGKAGMRNKLYPSTLFSGLLYCGCCGHEITLGRAGKYASFACPNGTKGVHGCTYGGYKTVSIVENSLLQHLNEELLTPARLEQLIELANAHLLELAAQPRVDPGPLEKQVRELDARNARLTSAIEEQGGEIVTLVSRIQQNLKKKEELQVQLQDLHRRNRKPPAPLELKHVQRYVTMLHKLLRGQVGEAAPLLRELFGGRIVIHMEIPEGRKRSHWVAEIKGDLVPLLAKATQSHQDSDAHVWETVREGNCSMPIVAEVPIAAVPLPKRIAPEVVKLLEAGHAREEVARQCGVGLCTVARAWRWHVHGTETYLPLDDCTTFGPPPDRVMTPELIEQVAALRHEQGLKAREIAAKLGITYTTAERAHRRWHDQHPDQPGDIPWPVLCGRAGNLTAAVRRQICELARDGSRECEIVQQLGLSKGDVHSALRALQRHEPRGTRASQTGAGCSAETP